MYAIQSLNPNIRLYQELIKYKMNEMREIVRNKARLVAQGYNKIKKEQTMKKLARLEPLRLLMAIACVDNVKFYQMDVKSALLNGFMKQEIYVK